MPYAAFAEKFPDIAGPESRVVIVLNHATLPPGRYALIELYCNEVGCDCRRVFLNVYREETRTLEAVVAYGWESRDFYVRWMGDDDPNVIATLFGSSLKMGSPVTPLSDALLVQVKMALSDVNYVERLKRHYRMYREVIDRETPRAPVPTKVKVSKAPRKSPNSASTLPAGDSTPSLAELRDFRKFFDMISMKDMIAPASVKKAYRAFRFLHFFATALYVEKTCPPLNRCWDDLRGRYGKMAIFDDEVFVESWIFMDFPIDAEGNTVLDRFQAFCSANPDAMKEFGGFVKSAKASRLGLHQET
ncbi:MAG: hypothetical protein WCJ30_15110, partial [Deltaproteobacteria bacterium]